MSKKLSNIIIFVSLVILTAASVAAAFLGVDKAGAIAGSLPTLCFGIALIILFAFSFFRFPRLIKAPGLLMVHLGCIAILLGAAIGGSYSHFIRQELKEIPQMGEFRVGKLHKGQMQIDEANYSSVNRGISLDGLPCVDVLPYRIYLREFRLELYDSGMPKDYISELMIISDEGRHYGPFEIEVNKPLHYAGYHFYQSSYGQYSDGSYCTVLSVVSDNGLWLVYSGFFLLLSGVFWHLWFRPIAQWHLAGKKDQIGGPDAD